MADKKLTCGCILHSSGGRTYCSQHGPRVPESYLVDTQNLACDCEITRQPGTGETIEYSPCPSHARLPEEPREAGVESTSTPSALYVARRLADDGFSDRAAKFALISIAESLEAVVKELSAISAAR